MCHCILQEMLEVAGGNEKLRNLMITDYRVQLLSAIIANYVEQVECILAARMYTSVPITREPGYALL